MARDFVEFYLNGKSVKLQGESVFKTLSDYLRYERRLTGTKVVCAEGDCGACTVMVSKFKPKAKTNEFESLNSCIAMMFLLDGAHIVSVEGLSDQDGLCEIQNSMVRNFGGQCGFCTPGFVMALTDLYERKSKPTEKQVKNFLTGNLCRCTGYSPIIKAALDVNADKHRRLRDRYVEKVGGITIKMPVHVTFGEKEFFAPTDLAAASKYRTQNPEVVIFSGSTDLGVQYNKGKIRPTKFMSLHLIQDLYTCERQDEEFVIGAKATLKEFRKLIEDELPTLGGFVNIFASPQIKHAATLVGNIANASPIADTTPSLMTLDAEVELFGPKGARRLPLKDLYLGYKKLALESGEVISFIRFKKPSPGSIHHHYKISQRRDLDISCVNASFLLELNRGSIKTARLSFGGVGPTTLRLPKVEAFLEGKTATADLFSAAGKQIVESIQPISDARGSAEFRKKLAKNLFAKFISENVQL